MPSQYITYLLVFVVGLMLVVFSDNILYNLTEDFSDSIAHPEFEKTVDRVRDQILHGVSVVQQNSESTLIYNLNLPQTIAKKYPYQIIVDTNTNGYYFLRGRTSQQFGDALEVNSSLSLNVETINIQGYIESTNSNSKIIISQENGFMSVTLV